MPYCFDETEVDGETVRCEMPPDHDGQHVGHVPQDDLSGLKWPLYSWED